jgi:nitrogen fixation/metabolism regulation signal transduction histidine kinase
MVRVAHRALRRLLNGPAPIIALALLLLASLTLMSSATENSARFGQTYSILLIINTLGLLTLSGLIGWNLFQLLRQVRRRVAGARLTVRMVAMFVLLSVTPVLVVYFFSMQFLHRGIDSWFDLRIEDALENALDLSRTALGVRMRELLRQTEAMAAELSDVRNGIVAVHLDAARRRSGATELTLMNDHGRILASSRADASSIVPHRPSEAILMQMRQSRDYIGLDPLADEGLHVRVVVGLPDPASASESRILQALYPITERMNTLADSVQAAYAQYRELAYLRKPLKISFTLTLSLVLLLGLLTAVWAAFVSVRRLVAPLRDLAQGTQAVAEGDYETQLPKASRDEIGFLVESFNDMTRKLARARDETRKSQQQVEAQRTYLEAVLARLSSGVVTLDHDLQVITANDSARRILGVDLDEHIGQTLTAISEQYPNIQPFTETLRSQPRDTVHDWRAEVILLGTSGRQVLMCRGTRLLAAGELLPGHVVVFDDVTALIQAQRNAAWSEVARRLAHEIKNPLTPIQLSAERLRRKYLRKMSESEAEVLDNLTRTIIQQVESMKEMVNAFSDYARTPRMRPQALDLNALITDIVELYRTGGRSGVIETQLDANLPVFAADPDRLRQALHNLVKNALEASGAQRPRVFIETACVWEETCKYIDVSIGDEGSGFPEHVIGQVFEPYVTTKPEGSGLGLAIVKKIVEEHGGLVWAKNMRDGGARVTMRFPVVSHSVPETIPAPPEEAHSAHSVSALSGAPRATQGHTGAQEKIV